MQTSIRNYQQSNRFIGSAKDFSSESDPPEDLTKQSVHLYNCYTRLKLT